MRLFTFDFEYNEYEYSFIRIVSFKLDLFKLLYNFALFFFLVQHTIIWNYTYEHQLGVGLLDRGSFKRIVVNRMVLFDDRVPGRA